MTRKIMSQIKQCKAKWCNNIFTVYNSIQKHCSNCMIENNNQKTLKNYKPVKKISDKKKNRLSKFSEKDLFRSILIERWNDWCLTCMYCNKIFSMDSAWPASFPHLLSKKMFPALRLFPNNIWIVCNDINTNSCHNLLDWVVNEIKKDLWKEFETMIASWQEVFSLIRKKIDEK